jgi:hypothetical protein
LDLIEKNPYYICYIKDPETALQARAYELSKWDKDLLYFINPEYICREYQDIISLDSIDASIQFMEEDLF